MWAALEHGRRQRLAAGLKIKDRKQLEKSGREKTSVYRNSEKGKLGQRGQDKECGSAVLQRPEFQVRGVAQSLE